MAPSTHPLFELRPDLVSGTDIPLMTFDLQGRINWMNRAAETLTGYTLGEVIGRTPGSVLNFEKTDRHTVSMLTQAVRDCRPVVAELISRSKAGREYWARVQLEPYTDASGAPVGLLCSQLDITEQRQAVFLATRSTSQAMAAVSHELRTPLNALLHLGELLEQSGLNAEQRLLCQQSRAAVEGLLALVNEVMDQVQPVAAPRTPNLLPTALGELIQQALNLVQVQAPGVRFELDLSRANRVPAVMVERDRLYRALLSLMNHSAINARQALVKVSLEARIAQSSHAGTAWELCLAVTGAAQIDDPALGHSLAVAALRGMGSELHHTDEGPAGYRFWFVLNVIEASPSQPAALRHLPARLDGKRILLVDDNPLGLLACARQLRRLGAQVVECRDGKHAIESLESAPAGEFDIVLMDIQMPQMDGFEAAKRIRSMAAWKDLPVLALTAGHAADDEQRAQKAGMVGVLHKPFELAQLAALIVRETSRAR